MRTSVRVYAELVDLAGAAEVDVLVGGPRSVKDLVESLGVPHPEVGLLLVDGEPVGFAHPISGGERVAVYPPFHDLEVGTDDGVWPDPPEPRRFVLDVHLGTLARRLRLLGFDSWYQTDVDDHELARVAVTDDRILLTRDRELLMRRVVRHGYCPRADDPDVQLGEVVDRYRLLDRLAPMTRCVRCNGRLEAVEPAEVVASLPPRTRREHDRFSRCTSCAQVYWPGSHLEPISAIVTAAGGTVERGSPSRDQP